MYKAAAQHPLLGWIFHQKSEISYLSGYSLRRHRTGTDVMLQKIDSWDVKDIRTIVLLDSEANQTYKYIGRESMRSAIDHGKFPPEQYSRPQRSATANGINHRLVFDYQQYLLQPFSLAFSDLKICYDIILHLAAILALQRLWITLLAIIIMINTTQRMTHTVRTSCGYSNLTYGGDTIPEEFRHFIMGL